MASKYNKNWSHFLKMYILIMIDFSAMLYKLVLLTIESHNLELMSRKASCEFCPVTVTRKPRSVITIAETSSILWVFQLSYFGLRLVSGC